jgi:hypothetical protein
LAFILWHSSFMIEHEKTNKARIVGYALGVVVVIAVVAWKFATR